MGEAPSGVGVMAFLLDTNHLSAMIRRNPSLREEVRRRHHLGERFATCWPVLCELETGIQDTHRPENYRRNLALVLKEVRIWPFDWQIVRLFGTTMLGLGRIGRTLSQVDVMLAAFAQHYSATILTTDSDFDALPDIKTENWLKP
jgi:tRNA(fMet)-specific endonuclease VapC